MSFWRTLVARATGKTNKQKAAQGKPTNCQRTTKLCHLREKSAKLNSFKNVQFLQINDLGIVTTLTNGTLERFRLVLPADEYKVHGYAGEDHQGAVHCKKRKISQLDRDFSSTCQKRLCLEKS